MRYNQHQFAVLIGCVGLSTAACIRPPEPAPLDVQDQSRFRALSIQNLREAAFCDDPVLRMQAMEAIQEVASADAASCIADNIDNGYAGVSFAALMALGDMRRATADGSARLAVANQNRLLQRVRTLAEDRDPNVRIAALYALHAMGDATRTRELADFLLRNTDARVRANAALAIGRLRDPTSIQLLHQGLKREKKDAVKMQILEALASLGDSHGIERLKFYGFSAVPDQAALALMCLANARTIEAEEMFRIRLRDTDYPEIRLQAARGLGRLGFEEGLDTAVRDLFFNRPRRNIANDPPQQQIARVRALAALALEAIDNPTSLGPLWSAFNEPDQSPYVRLAISRAALRLIDGHKSDAARPTGHESHRAPANRVAGTGVED
ncbi:HEAT repeat protein [Phycisphaerae bacterium RAS2]|nr:HEAT repeat protein [Phycisphaerae bacterium RAS2]